MKLEHQVISLDLAKRLKELGVKQESAFHWLDRDGANGTEGNPPLLLYEKTDTNRHRHAAFTVAELGEMLPHRVDRPTGEEFYLACYKHDEKWEVVYDREGGDKTLRFWIADTEAEARGLMLVYLIEKGLLTP